MFSSKRFQRFFRWEAFVLPFLLCFPSGAFAQEAVSAVDASSYADTFIISAYYSPCPGQNHYVTGSYEGDIRLNGNGTNGADGTPVYPGMIAAPSKYPFGTKLSVPGIGVVAVHDRGGAIVSAGQRGHAHDRLDVWMGSCDEGLVTALNWGVRTVEGVVVYGLAPSLQESTYLEAFSVTEAVVKNVVLSPKLFTEDLWQGSDGEDVGRLQQILKDLGHYSGDITQMYDDATVMAVFEFQKSRSILDSLEDWGAGHFGVNTRKALDFAVVQFEEEQGKVAETKKEEAVTLLLKYNDLPQEKSYFLHNLSVGSRGDEVRALQEELARLGYLRITPSDYGYYGDVTEHAVFKLQQKWRLVGTLASPGAGIFGAKTREMMNSILKNRLEAMTGVALNRHDRDNKKMIVAAPSSTFSRELGFGDRGDDVQALQSLLKRLGFFQGAFVTPFFGEQTQAAVSSFQLSNGLIVALDDPNAGKVETRTLELLNHFVQR